jgi:ABC-type cobalamin transport system permease subunit
MDNFERAAARTHRLARRLLKEGVAVGVVADAFATEALSLWAAQTGYKLQALALLRAWHRLREMTDGE